MKNIKNKEIEPYNNISRHACYFFQMLEEEAGVMRNAMTTRAPCGANKICLMKQMKSNLGA